MHNPILIVEDHEDTLMAIETLLVCSNFQCRGAGSRDEAHKLLQSGFAPSCVIMDYYMPGMRLEEFLDQTATLKLRLILTTAAQEAPDIAKRFGIAHVVAKPIYADRLIETVQRILAPTV